MNIKDFYDTHRNFALRTILEYYISPGTRCKYDILRRELVKAGEFPSALDLGCSGNSFLFFANAIAHNSLLDLAEPPLKQYLSLSTESLKDDYEKHQKKVLHPINADICHLPYRAESFDLISALDVLEHLKDDIMAIDEITRVLKKKGYLLITAPHNMKYFDRQDMMIGHYRRYELKEFKRIFIDRNFRIIKVFGVYGQLFKISKFQQFEPQAVEEGLISLRTLYQSSKLFRSAWHIFVSIIGFLMRIDARYQPLKRILNIGVLLQKRE
jgi:ubiquinone/menaquinone biosynthesis C-methylase UbiE